MERDEEALDLTTRAAEHSWYTHLWHRETFKNAESATNSHANDDRSDQDTRESSENGALLELGPALENKLLHARRRFRDLHNKAREIFTMASELWQQFAPGPEWHPGDVTAGAVGWIVYLFRTSNEKPVWKTTYSEVRLSALLYDPRVLANDFETWKQKEGISRYERRWIHLPANNMEWVELIMRRIIENFAIKHGGITSDQSSEAVDRVVRHVLHPKRWVARQNDRSPYMLHARSMEPLAQQFTVASKSCNPEFLLLSKRSFVFFMPYLSWERSTVAMYRNIVYNHARANAESLSKDGRLRVESNVAATSTAKIPCCEREALLRNYLFTSKPLHLRRTLDQSYYTMMSDTSRRDEDQVAERHARGQTHWQLRDRLDPCILMVDYVWLWALNQDTVVTCFPRPWNHANEFEDSDLFEMMQQRIVKKLNKREAKPGKTRIARLVAETCAKYLKKMGKSSRCHQFMHFFEHALRKVKDDKSLFLRSGVLTADRLGNHENFLDISKELKALGEVMDIIDETQMILNVLDEQIDLLTKFDSGLVKTRVDNKGDPWDDWRILGKIKKDKAFWERILKKANENRDEIRDLVELKQQHATIKLATDTSQQSNAIMLFTMVTILFLPLSTLAALFGVNASNFGQGEIPLSTIFACIFLISIVIVLIVVVLVTNQSVRQCVTLILQILIAQCKLFLPSGMLDKCTIYLTERLDKLHISRRRIILDRLEKRKKRKQEKETKEQLENERLAHAHGRTRPSLSKQSTEDDNEFEEDSNLDLDDDKTSTSVGTKTET